MDGVIPARPEDSPMKEPVLIGVGGSLFDPLEEMVPFWMLWRMRWRTHTSRKQQNQPSENSQSLLNSHTITFPNNLPDNEDDDIPWHDESPEEYD
jgi:hypothetical protein